MWVWIIHAEPKVCVSFPQIALHDSGQKEFNTQEAHCWAEFPRCTACNLVPHDPSLVETPRRGAPDPYSTTAESAVSQTRNAAAKRAQLRLINASKYHRVTWCFLLRKKKTKKHWNLISESENVRTWPPPVKNSRLKIPRGPWLTGKKSQIKKKKKDSLRKKDTGKGVAGMEAFKTILDIQASQLTLVSPRGVLGGGDGGGLQSVWPWLTERTPPLTLQVAERH